MTIPSNVASIGQWAFCGCSSLTTITLPSSVTSIGDGAFAYCGSLTNATWPSSVASIGGWAFEDCTNLTSITVPSTLGNIGDFAFDGCTSLTSIAIPGGVCCIGDFTFYGCASLTNVTMAAGVTQIRQCAFGGCTSLESITLPSTVVCIMGNAFEGCSSLNTVLFDGSAPSTGSEVFNDADNVTVYRMPSAVGWGATLDGRPVLLWPPLPPAPHAATATGSVINGFVVAASITDEGWGYTNTPPVRIIGGGGSGAQAVALVTNGVLVAVDVVAAGSGYTSAPVVIIEPPFIPQPTMGITVLTFGPQVSPVLELNLGSLSPYDNYQLEFTPAVGGAWTNLGNPFTPTSSAIVQYANGTGKLGFFRVKYVP